MYHNPFNSTAMEVERLLTSSTDSFTTDILLGLKLIQLSFLLTHSACFIAEKLGELRFLLTDVLLLLSDDKTKPIRVSAASFQTAHRATGFPGNRRGRR